MACQLAYDLPSLSPWTERGRCFVFAQFRSVAVAVAVAVAVILEMDLLVDELLRT